MADYEVLVSRRAADEIEDLPKSIATRVYAKLEALAHEPRLSGVKKLRGSAKGWRIRVGDYRVLFEVDDERRVVDVAAVRHRSKAYD
ncbi:MAG TPA: type II toxin-antitoxin system RelE/ParE family toxin [Thermoanaerobaculia bacterium]|nr:type II toxin-antitoxin system RelE/ParE family toxin [Thermoanaerobaculia bacterium]